MNDFDKKFEQIVSGLNIDDRPNAEHKKTLRKQMLTASENATSDKTAPCIQPVWSKIMKSNITKSAAAAVVIVAVFIGIKLLDGTPAYAIEQTIEALRGVQNLSMSISTGNQSTKLLMLINQQTGLADHIRMDTLDSGNVTITVPGQTYSYNKQKNEVTLLPQELLKNDLNFKDVINSLVEQTNAVDGRLQIIKEFNDIARQKVIVVTIIRKDESIAGEFLIDPESNLPLYIGTESHGQLNYMGPIEYNVEMPANAFEFVIPEGAKVIDNRPEELKNMPVEINTGFSFELSKTVEAMKKVHNVHSIFIDREGRRVNAWGKIDSTTGMVSVMRLKYQDGGLYIITPDQTYFEDDGLIAVKEGQYMKCGLLFNDFISETAQRMQNLGMMEVKKQYSEEFQREVICVNIKQPQVHLEAIVDPETKLPIKFSIPWVSYPNEPLDYIELIEYNVDLPPDFFDFEVRPDTMILGKHLDKQFANDPNYGIPYNATEDLQDFCERLATEYLQAKINRNIKKIKQLHAGHVNRYGSSKMIKNKVILDEYQNGKVTEILGFKPSYEYGPRQMMVPCKVVKEHNGQSQEMFSGVLIYLREHDGQKSATITGWFPRLSEKQIDNSK